MSGIVSNLQKSIRLNSIKEEIVPSYASKKTLYCKRLGFCSERKWSSIRVDDLLANKKRPWRFYFLVSINQLWHSIRDVWLKRRVYLCSQFWLTLISKDDFRSKNDTLISIQKVNINWQENTILGESTYRISLICQDTNGFEIMGSTFRW